MDAESDCRYRQSTDATLTYDVTNDHLTIKAISTVLNEIDDESGERYRDRMKLHRLHCLVHGDYFQTH